MLRSRDIQWWASCVAVLLGAILTQAQEAIPAPRSAPPDQSPPHEATQFQGPSCLPPSAAMPCGSTSQPKVVIHMQKPEVVYDEAPAASCNHGLLGRFLKKHQQPPVTGSASATSVLTPLSYSSGVVGQNFALNGLSLQAISPQLTGYGAQSFGSQGTDLSGLRAAQELELHAAHLATIQAAREAESRVFGASVQRIRSHISSISPQGTKPEAKTAESDSCCEQIKKDIQDLKDKIASLDGQIKEIKKVCDDIKAKQK